MRSTSNKHFDIYEDIVDDQTRKCKRCGKDLLKKQKSFCSYKCSASARKLTIEIMHKLAVARGGKCLSTVYVNCDTKLMWECAKEHQWEATPSSMIYQKSWCLKCSGRNKLTIEDMHELAIARSGKCLSTVYVNNKTKLLWRCADGHNWKAQPCTIRNGSWCPYCNYINQNKCRYILEKLFSLKFAHNRRIFSNKFEADGYCKKLHMAFEYNGLQHYKFVEHFHKDKAGFEVQQRRDKEKYRLYKNKKIKLVIIPYWVAKSDDELSEYIINELLKLGHEINNKKIDWFDFYAFLSQLKKMRKLAVARGGKCLSTVYMNTNTKLKWQCAKKHQWEASPNHVQQGHWCPDCGWKRKTIQNMYELATAKNGKCLSKIYANAHNKLKWQCAKGHQWEAVAYSIIYQGSWCPKCAIDRRRQTRIKNNLV